MDHGGQEEFCDCTGSWYSTEDYVPVLFVHTMSRKMTYIYGITNEPLQDAEKKDTPIVIEEEEEDVEYDKSAYPKTVIAGQLVGKIVAWNALWVFKNRAAGRPKSSKPSPRSSQRYHKWKFHEEVALIKLRKKFGTNWDQILAVFFSNVQFTK